MRNKNKNKNSIILKISFDYNDFEPRIELKRIDVLGNFLDNKIMQEIIEGIIPIIKKAVSW